MRKNRTAPFSAKPSLRLKKEDVGGVGLAEGSTETPGTEPGPVPTGEG